MSTTQNIKPRVHKTKRLVCVHHPSLEMFEVYKINKNGTVNKRVAPEFAYSNDVDEAFRKMSYARAGFMTVPGLKCPKTVTTWTGWVEYIWQQANL